MSKLLNKHIFTFNKQDNGGELLSLTTEIYDNGDDKDFIYLNQKLELMSYTNSVSINLSGAQITPDLLRKLANELDLEILKSKSEKIK